MHPLNRLNNESSLYLRQHARNPVDWFPWGEEALQQARELNRPIFLSIGYSACHWCHVMERESFEDEATAAIMNEHFVNVKVDREERPDLDQIYMTSLQLLTREGGGWPLSVFLTPDLTPFYAGTYFPPRDMYGRPSFRRVLQSVADAWAGKRAQLESLGRQVADALRESAEQQAGEAIPSDAALRSALAALKRSADPEHGGFGRAPKFPHPIDLRLLLRLHHRFGDADALAIATRALAAMARGGIYDQIGGGFHRYSVDERWLVPHFEKMLYDNALLIPACIEAFQITGAAFFRQIAEETIGYVLREMTSPAGAFYSTQDADSEGEEGKFYVWSEAEFRAVLGDHAEFGSRVWGVTPTGNFEGQSILYRRQSDAEDARSLGMTDDDFRERLQRCKELLYAHRANRVWPGRDEKILAAWNGLMIAALARAHGTTRDARHLDAARAAADFLLTRLRDADGRLLRTCGHDQPAKITAYLEDYACAIEGLIELYQADFNARWVDAACTLADRMMADYSDERGGFYFTAAGRGDLIARTRDWQDGSTPSGNGMAATVLFRLAILCDRDDYRKAAERTLAAFAGPMTEYPAATAQLLTALDWSLGPTREIALRAPAHHSDAARAIASMQASYHPRRLLAFADAAAAEPPTIALLRNRPGQENDMVAYICEGGQCSAPLVGAAAALAHLESLDRTAATQ